MFSTAANVSIASFPSFLLPLCNLFLRSVMTVCKLVSKFSPKLRGTLPPFRSSIGQLLTMNLSRKYHRGISSNALLPVRPQPQGHHVSSLYTRGPLHRPGFQTLFPRYEHCSRLSWHLTLAVRKYFDGAEDDFVHCSCSLCIASGICANISSPSPAAYSPSRAAYIGGNTTPRWRRWWRKSSGYFS